MDDLISRQAAIEYFKRIIDATNMNGRYNLGFIDGLEFCINHLSTMPSAQPERQKGKWKVDWEWGIATCTNCKHDYDDGDNGYLNEMRYCPFCGAKMEIEE